MCLLGAVRRQWGADWGDVGMSKWDITPSGVEFVTSLVGDAIGDIDTGVRSYGKHVESAATSAGTLSEPVCGAPQTGPVGAALALLVEKSMREALFIGALGVTKWPRTRSTRLFRHRRSTCRATTNGVAATSEDDRTGEHSGVHRRSEAAGRGHLRAAR